MFFFVKGKCLVSQVFAFIQNTTIMSTMSFNGAYNLPTDGMNSSLVSSGAFVPMVCRSGYVLIAGQLNITCNNDAWTTFPICSPITVSDDMNAGARASNNTIPCILDATTFNLTNGYYSNMSLSYSTNTMATGN